MLHQLPSPPTAQAGEVALLAPPIESILYSEASSGASSLDAVEEPELPQCKVRRNYKCVKCNYHTQNPRAFLLHLRQVHFEKFKIFDCPHCIYASRHLQKLQRHLKMVHTGPSSSSGQEIESQVNSFDAVESSEQVDDMFEEVEECEEFSMISEDRVDPDGYDNVDSDCRNTVGITGSNISRHKSKYFSCDKCNYATHIKSRFTKHVKYHSMPMIKCNMCDFRTPYKWNLDRHMKNHGGTGTFNCSMCNFTADIKQSLTVHEMNHHPATEGLSFVHRRRNRVGASDIAVTYDDGAPVKEEDGSGDSCSSYSASEMGLHADIEMVTYNSESNDGSFSDETNKNDVTDIKDHNSSSEDAKYGKQIRKPPRPIPQLIPLNTSVPNPVKNSLGEPPTKKFKESSECIELDSKNKFEAAIPTTIISAPKEPIMRKKNESFFEKLKERLLNEKGDQGSLVCKNCGFESKCLSEHSVHEKNCQTQSSKVLPNNSHTTLGSTRCQNCRHRCKSSVDLYNHMQSCGTTGTKAPQEVSNSPQIENHLMNLTETSRHPMENVVFVWNNINQDNENNKFDTPLGINITDDSTLNEGNRTFESENVDENESMNLSPSNAAGKKVFKCPHCPFWASTASRFHVHIVGHLNKKPFECSLCKYKSNWRWDITKHIKLKSARDPEHNEANVLMTDETGRRNYSKYSKFLALSILNEHGETEFRYIDPNTTADCMMEVYETSENHRFNASGETQPLNLQTNRMDPNYVSCEEGKTEYKKPKTLWKCKKCNYKDPSKDALLEHVKEHSRSDDSKSDNAKKLDNMPDPADLAYRCGHCNQLSNWKHVIQRHCRLKHEGIIKVITTLKPKPDPNASLSEINTDYCTKCPYKSDDKAALLQHLQQHEPSPDSIFKCYFCPYFVKSEQELFLHLSLHGINDPEEYIAKAMGCKSPLPDTPANNSGKKRHRCPACPYETNSKSQFLYHEQFHKLPASADTPYKCPECNYSVSKRHLLHQHMKVHGIIIKKNDDLDLEMSQFNKSETALDISINLDEIPYVWVSAKNEFHKMYKCRYCSYVNSQECKIPNHEKIHCIELENSEIMYKCLECKFTSNNAGRLAEHAKGHGEIYGRIYCPVEDDIPDQEQIAKLHKVIEMEKANQDNQADSLVNSEGNREEPSFRDGEMRKILYFCHKCPARFFDDNSLRIHDKFHDLSFTKKCKHCAFSVAEESEMSAHILVHTDEYHTKTKMLKFIHSSHPAHKEPRLKLIHCPITSDIAWVVVTVERNYEVESFKKSDTKHSPKQYHCKECPAKFFKTSALNYHAALHGGEGDHKCRTCSYTVKNSGNLAKHELLHEIKPDIANCDYESGDDIDFKNIPLSGTDLFQRKTEAQKRVLTDKDKLVKPNDHFPPVLQADPQFGYLMHGNPEFIYPTYFKNGRQKEKRYKCHKCPSAFEKREQYKIHLSLHGSKQRYKCELCDYSVKYYANYVQHMRKHQMNDEAQAERKKGCSGLNDSNYQEHIQDDNNDNVKLAIKTMPRRAPKSDFQQFSINDQQTLRILQRRRSINNSDKEPNTEETPTKERKQHMCLLCPYTNQRQDALSNHYKRHDDPDVLSTANHKCPYCDFIVTQSHFLREHMKCHFSYLKNLTPECFAANKEVTFTITKLDEDNVATDLTIDNNNKVYNYSMEDKIFVNIKTGELTAE